MVDMLIFFGIAVMLLAPLSLFFMFYDQLRLERLDRKELAAKEIRRNAWTAELHANADKARFIPERLQNRGQ